jgi:hypothetical protein
MAERLNVHVWSLKELMVFKTLVAFSGYLRFEVVGSPSTSIYDQKMTLLIGG